MPADRFNYSNRLEITGPIGRGFLIPDEIYVGDRINVIMGDIARANRYDEQEFDPLDRYAIYPNGIDPPRRGHNIAYRGYRRILKQGAITYSHVPGTHGGYFRGDDNYVRMYWEHPPVYYENHADSMLHHIIRFHKEVSQYKGFQLANRTVFPDNSSRIAAGSLENFIGISNIEEISPLVMKSAEGDLDLIVDYDTGNPTLTLEQMAEMGLSQKLLLPGKIYFDIKHTPVGEWRPESTLNEPGFKADEQRLTNYDPNPIGQNFYPKLYDRHAGSNRYASRTTSPRWKPFDPSHFIGFSPGAHGIRYTGNGGFYNFCTRQYDHLYIITNPGRTDSDGLVQPAIGTGSGEHSGTGRRGTFNFSGVVAPPRTVELSPPTNVNSAFIVEEFEAIVEDVEYTPPVPGVSPNPGAFPQSINAVSRSSPLDRYQHIADLGLQRTGALGYIEITCTINRDIYPWLQYSFVTINNQTTWVIVDVARLNKTQWEVTFRFNFQQIPIRLSNILGFVSEEDWRAAIIAGTS